MRIDLGDIQIRPYTEGDIPSLAARANSASVSRDLREAFPFPYTRKDAETWLDQCRRFSPLTHFAMADPSGVIGGIGLIPGEDVHRIEAELGYWLAASFWGRGIMSRAVDAFVPEAAARFGFHRIFARVFARNKASARVLEKTGFTREALLKKSAVKDGVILDETLFARVFP
jgi:RimJ/RimL family protein N-acetyltransferase